MIFAGHLLALKIKLIATILFAGVTAAFSQNAPIQLSLTPDIALQPIQLNEKREIAIQIRNIGEVTAENTTVLFSTRINTTNLIADGWTLQPAGLSDIINGKIIDHDNDFNGWICQANTPIESKGEIFRFATLRISTNEPSFIAPAYFRIFANRSKQQEFYTVLISTN
jgi:hypothetical protein